MSKTTEEQIELINEWIKDNPAFSDFFNNEILPEFEKCVEKPWIHSPKFMTLIQLVSCYSWVFATKTAEEANIKCEPTDRGFLYGEFVDRYGVKCSIQESSIATERCLWLGSNDIGLKGFRPGRSWREISKEEIMANFGEQDLIANNRMHLSEDNVRQLVATLQHWLNKGSLPQ